MVLTAIDLFAGAGGFTTGAAAAGVRVLWAANHWPLAVKVHRQNHGEPDHACQDLHQADWTRVPRADIVLASPACQGHSKARGLDRPHHDATRATAWAVVSCAEMHRPRALIVENVEEFQQWSLFPAWRLALQALGYRLTAQVIDSADCGVPQHRRRLFIVGLLGREAHVRKPNKPWRAFSAVARWSEGSWGPVVRPRRSPKTIARWEAGRAALGDRFVMPYYGSGSGLTGRTIDRPLGTVTTRDRWALVDGDRMRMLTVAEYRSAMGFPKGYRLPAVRAKAIYLLGNAVCPPVAEHVVREVAKAVA